MITGEIKLYKEPEPYKPPPVVTVTATVVTPPQQKSANGNILPFNTKVTPEWRFFELQKEQNRAYNLGVRIGTKWRLSPGAHAWVEILGFNMTPEYISTIDGKPAIIRGSRRSKLDTRTDLNFSYTVDEILEMELVDD